MSKIPEGTQFIEAGCGEKGFRKFEKGCWWFFEGFWRHVDWKMGALTLVTEHPDHAAPATTWTGEGLPPVGVLCEMSLFADDNWALCTPVYYLNQPDDHSDQVVVYQNSLGGDVCYILDPPCAGSIVFRPVRTPEQIAAEERAAGITQMRELVGSLNSHPFAELWDAGYRKQPAP